LQKLALQPTLLSIIYIVSRYKISFLRERVQHQPDPRFLTDDVFNGARAGSREHTIPALLHFTR